MTAITSRRTNRLTPESMVQIVEMVEAINLKFEPMRETIAMATEAFNRQQIFIKASLAPAVKALELAEAKQAEYMPQALEIMEASQRQEPVNLFPYEPEVRRREPDISVEERAFLRGLMNQRKADSFTLQNQSLFCRDTHDLFVQGKRIRLRPTEKAICGFFFQNPQNRCLKLDAVERAIYGEVLTNSDRLKQAIKRINQGAREVHLPNIFSYGGGFLTVII